MRNPHAGVPFDTPDDQIAAALRDVSIPTLMLSMLHMTGDADLIRGELRPAGLFLNEVQGFMSEEDKDAVRARALEVIKDYRDRGCPEPEPLSETQPATSTQARELARAAIQAGTDVIVGCSTSAAAKLAGLGTAETTLYFDETARHAMLLTASPGGCLR